jgi:ABC-type Fe3+-citrate transport system substrate-binding protein
VTDLLLVAVIVAFFLLAALLVRACSTVTEQSTDYELDVEDDEPKSETAR